MPVNENVLAVAAEIERRDGDVAAALDIVADLSRRADEVRRRSERVQRFLESTPGELARLDLAEAESRDALAAAAEGLAAAEQRAAGDAGAEEELERARLVADDAAVRHRHLVAERAALLETEASSRAEIGELVRDAGDVAERLAAVPRVSESGREPPGATLTELTEWSRRVHAALFVVRGQLETDRDRLIREANELAGAVLGEQVAGSNVSLVRRRLEEAAQR